MPSPVDAVVPYAHSRPPGDPRPWEPLSKHLAEVAALAARFAGAFDSPEWGRIAGWWHDVGKYRPDFQRRIQGEAVLAPHASAGAALAAERRLEPIASVIAAHHAGLANLVDPIEGGPMPLRDVLRDGAAVLATIRTSIPAAVLEQVTPPVPAMLRAPVDRAGQLRAQELWTRMLFSALVDADYLATEAFYDPHARVALDGFATVGELAGRLDARLDGFEADTAVNRLRAGVLADCRAASSHAPGFFSFTVPTGGGKTLSGMSFALRHAAAHAMTRVIVVVPFTSIIEQNAAVYRDVLGADQVIEHHSAVDEQGRERADSALEVRRRLAAENWDAPVVVTTAVQFFESLFANAPSRCRKLHNVVRSVIILDEAQTLPTDFLIPVLDALRELVRGYGCSVVLSTATQPALTRRAALPYGLDDVREIVGDASALAAALRRVRVHWPPPGASATPYAEVARALAAESRVLAVVHRRPDAHALAEQVPAEGRHHLSTRMCAAHRAATLDAIRAALRAGATCRVVSTQLVEAGVDVSFPVVWRALAGLDSLAQAAGRCNRHGELTDAEGAPRPGDFVVFRAETPPPPGGLRKGMEVTEQLLASAAGTLDLGDPEVQRRYFQELYARVPHDPKGVQPLRERLAFADVARRVRLVEDEGQVAIVVPWGEAAARLQAYERTPSRATARALGPYLVQVHERDERVLRRLGALGEVAGFGGALLPHYAHLYHPEFGLLIDEEAPAAPGALIA